METEGALNIHTHPAQSAQPALPHTQAAGRLLDLVVCWSAQGRLGDPGRSSHSAVYKTQNLTAMSATHLLSDLSL